MKAFGRDIVHMNLHPRHTINLREGDDLAGMPDVDDGVDFPESRSAPLGGEAVSEGQSGFVVGRGHISPFIPLR